MATNVTANPPPANRNFQDAYGQQILPPAWDNTPLHFPTLLSWVAFTAVVTADPGTLDPVNHTSTGLTLLSLAGNKVAMAAACYFNARLRRKPGTTAVLAVDNNVYIFKVNAVEVGRATAAKAGEGAGGVTAESFGSVSFFCPSGDTRFAMNGTNDFTIDVDNADASIEVDVEIAGI